jgi:hypothetical protein
VDGPRDRKGARHHGAGVTAATADEVM